MKNFLSIDDLPCINTAVKQALTLKKSPWDFEHLGKRKTIGLLFFNNSLRTRVSTEKAGKMLGLEVITMQFGRDGWALEFEDGAVMDKGTTEHIKEAAKVLSQYCDIIAIRCFATLVNEEKDRSEKVLHSFARYATVPIVNMESATGHPLQALADAMTIAEHQKTIKPKVVLSWAPHPKPLPQAVANSFLQALRQMDVSLSITHPEGYELDPQFSSGLPIVYDQKKAFENADFIYAKNWSSLKEYGKVLYDPKWTIDAEKMALTNDAKFMHCLPVRRNVVVSDAVLDHPNSLVIAQANNRTFATQHILKKILENA